MKGHPVPILVNALRLFPSLAYRALMPVAKQLLTSRVLERALIEYAETLAKRTDSDWDDQAVEAVKLLVGARK